jgi:hypothetical protein
MLRLSRGELDMHGREVLADERFVYGSVFSSSAKRHITHA